METLIAYLIIGAAGAAGLWLLWQLVKILPWWFWFLISMGGE